MRIAHPYHTGERRVQEAAGERAAADATGRVIADAIVPGAVRFMRRQHLVVIASLDPRARPWASLVLGRPGFVSVPDPRRVELDLRATFTARGDKLWENLRGQPGVGLLFIDLGARIRYRANGRVIECSAERLGIEVAEAYPNCPQYIQRRHARLRGRLDATGAPEAGVHLGADERVLPARADTAFVASVSGDGRLDASHRGGHPGFIQALDERTLRIPDYRGNSMFNTLGNLAVNPVAGLTVPDFDHGTVL